MFHSLPSPILIKIGGWRSSANAVVLVKEKALYTSANFPAFHLLFPSNALCNAEEISFSPLIESRLRRFYSTFPSSSLLDVVFVAAVWNVLTPTKAKKIASRSVHLINILSMSISCFMFLSTALSWCMHRGSWQGRKTAQFVIINICCRLSLFCRSCCNRKCRGKKYRWRENYD